MPNSSADFNKLFYLNPQPMWIFEEATLKFLDVNKAAVSAYGYTKDEFLNMTIKDIRPEEDLKKLDKIIKRLHGDKLRSREFRHLTKAGQIKHVEVFSYEVDFGDKKGRIVLAIDITQRKVHQQELEDKNKLLQQMANFNSHQLRKPIANILGLIDLIEPGKFEPGSEIQSIAAMLRKSCLEIDQVIKQISDRIS